MNQQRARRFRSARERKEALEKARSEGIQVPENPFDSNCITPGTPFMTRLSEHIKYFVRHKISTDPAWRRCQIVFSGQEVPGEGEHKIMEFIRECKARRAFATREQSASPDPSCASLSAEAAAAVLQQEAAHKHQLAEMWAGYTVLSEGACAGEGWSADESHCIYGLDADLIMLGLLTHEVHFALLREKVLGLRRKGNRVQIKQAVAAASGTIWELLHLSLVREYLEEEFHEQGPLRNGQELELERVIDDILFLFFFIGNDFLPNLPYLDIKEGAMEVMLTGYKSMLHQFDGYITFKGDINWNRAREFIRQVIMPHEQQTLKEFELCFEQLGGRLTDEEADADELAGGIGALSSFFRGDGEEDEVGDQALAPALDAEQQQPAAPSPRSSEGAPNSPGGASTSVCDEAEMSWRDSYYTSKFEGRRRGHDVDFYKGVALSYAQGLAWVLRYYYDGCISWGWYFPQHYAPLATGRCGAVVCANVCMCVCMYVCALVRSMRCVCV
jgi:5'-3' exoribonuclease 1